MGPAEPTTRPKFVRPFEGRPKTIRHKSFCLFPPQVFRTLEGLPSIRRVFTDIGKEGLFKRMERAPEINTHSLKMLDEILMLAEPNDTSDFVELLRSCRAGNTEAIARFAELGEWRALLLSSENTPIEQRPRYQQFIFSLEQLSEEMKRHWRQKQYDAALARMHASAIMKQMLSEQDMAGFESGRPLHHLMRLHGVAVMESHLGLLVAMLMDAEPQNPGQFDQLRALLPNPQEPEMTPLKLLMRWLLQKAGVPSASALSDQLAWSGELPSGTDYLSNFKRWGKGTHFPKWETFEAVCKAVGVSDSDYPDGVYYFARHLNFLGYFQEQLRSELLNNAQHIPWLIFPCPKLSHGYSTFEEWVPARFESWYQFHMESQKD